MSTIFDALKRSDRERQMNSTHTLSYSHLNAEQDDSKSWIKYLLIALLLTVACLVAITLWFNRDKTDIGSPQVVTATEKSERPQPQVKADTKTKLTQVMPSEVEVAKVESANTQEPVASDTQTQPVEPGSRSSLSDLVIIPVSKKKVVEASRATEAVKNLPQTPVGEPQIDQVMQDNKFDAYEKYSSIRSSENLPDLHLDILMYHPDSSQRKAFINMNAYRQGEQISEGAELVEIGQKGVLLRYQGKEFVLSTN